MTQTISVAFGARKHIDLTLSVGQASAKTMYLSDVALSEGFADLPSRATPKYLSDLHAEISSRQELDNQGMN